MTDYRRFRVDGGTYFFTVNLTERHRKLLTEHIGVLREAFRAVKDAHPFTIDAIVILPDHLHAIWTLPTGDQDFSLRWRQIKSAFSRAMEKGERISESRSRKGERGVWQRRFWEHLIRDEDDFARHVDYIHYNPVKHGHVQAVSNWAVFVVSSICPMGYLFAGLGESGNKRIGFRIDSGVMGFASLYPSYGLRATTTGYYGLGGVDSAGKKRLD